MFETTIAGKPAQARLARRDEQALSRVAHERRGADKGEARRDAALDQEQEDAGIDIVSDGEQSPRLRARLSRFVEDRFSSTR